MTDAPTTNLAKAARNGAGRLAAVVVTYDRLALLKQCVTALLAASPEVLSVVVVVDNASTDGTAEWLAAQTDPRLDVVALPQNKGGAGGFEAGMRYAVAVHDPDWLVVMDDDSRPDPGALAVFHGLDLTGWDAVAAAVRLPDDTPCDMNRPTLNPFARPAVLLRALGGAGREAFHLPAEAFAGAALRQIDGASFVGLFLSRRAMAAGGYPEGRLFLYAEDAMYTLGLTRAGLRIAFAPMLRFRHEYTTFHPGDPRIRPLWKAYYYHRNLALLYRQIAGPWLFWPVLALYAPRWLFRARHYGPQRAAVSALIRLALRDAMAGRIDRPHAEILARAGGLGDGQA